MPLTEKEQDEAKKLARKPWLAHGFCEHCDFVGDMWFQYDRDPEDEDVVQFIAVCPECSCYSLVDKMPETGE